MKKRTLHLDREVLTSIAPANVDGGTGAICFSISLKIALTISELATCFEGGDGSNAETCGGVSCQTGCTGPENC
jgi:hypothetical protein